MCSASRSLERLGYDFAENPELDRWWDSHKAKDEERRRDEDRKREAERLKQEQLDAIMKKPFCDITKQELRLLKQSGAFG